MSRAERDMSADAGGVRLHRSTALDQVAHFDPGTGLWHSDELVEVVRYDEVLSTDGAENVTHIAYPAAQAKAMERVVDAARPAADWLEGGCYCPCCEQRNECVEDCTYASDAPTEWARMVVAREVALPLIKALATLPRAPGGEGGQR